MVDNSSNGINISISRTLIALGTLAWLLLAIVIGLVWTTAKNTLDASEDTKQAIIVNRDLIRENNEILHGLEQHEEVTEREVCRAKVAVEVDAQWRRAVANVLRAYVIGDFVAVQGFLPTLDEAAKADILELINRRC